MKLKNILVNLLDDRPSWKPKLVLLSTLILLASHAFSQSSEKATVYVAAGRSSNFRYFIDDQYLCKFIGNKYLKLELDPGEYLIWAKSGNYSFVEAIVQSGKTYFLRAKVTSGTWKAGVKLQPITDEDSWDMNSIRVPTRKLINRKKPFSHKEYLKKARIDKDKIKKIIDNGMKEYESLKGTDKIKKLDKPLELDIKKK